jgi:hypothetical protein
MCSLMEGVYLHCVISFVQRTSVYEIYLLGKDFNGKEFFTLKFHACSGD